MTNEEILSIAASVVSITDDACDAMSVSAAIAAAIVFANEGKEEALKFHEEYIELTKKYLIHEGE